MRLISTPVNLGVILSSIVFLLGLVASVSNAVSQKSTQEVDLASCDFWVGTIGSDRAVYPVCRCYQGKWSLPRVALIRDSKKDPADEVPIPPEWSKFENPPPLKWRTVCRDGNVSNVVVQGLWVTSDTTVNMRIEPEVWEGCIALSGNLSVRFDKKQRKRKDEVPLSTAELATLNIKGHHISIVQKVYTDGGSIYLDELSPDGESKLVCGR